MEQLFESENIRYVPVSERLVPDYLEMVNDIKHVGRFIRKRTEPVSEEQELRRVRDKRAEQALLFSMPDKQSGAFIGNVELMDPADSQAELGIAITARMQDRGYGTEAVRTVVGYGMKELSLRRIFLKVYPDNVRAIRCYEKCGFREYDRTDEDVFMEIIREDGEKGRSL